MKKLTSLLLDVYKRQAEMVILSGGAGGSGSSEEEMLLTAKTVTGIASRQAPTAAQDKSSFFQWIINVASSKLVSGLCELWGGKIFPTYFV